MPLWKLIALDLDGTLLNLNGQVSPLNREWLQKAWLKGIMITIVTGRHVTKVLPIVQELGINASLITSNGCEMWSYTGELLQRICLNSGQVDWIHAWAEVNRLLYRAYLTDRVHDWDPDDGADPIPGEWLKVLLKPKEARGLTALLREVQESGIFTVVGYCNEANGEVTSIDLQPKKVSKANALSVLCRQLGIEQAQVVAFGDDNNDVEMLKWAGLGVAMENATKSVHRAADRIAPHHNSDGVAEVLRELLQNDE